MNKAGELALGEMSMFCLIDREPASGRLLPASLTQLLLLLLVAFIGLVWVGRCGRTAGTIN